MFCENCGAKLEDDAVFCEQCGQKVTKSEGTDSTEQKGTASGSGTGTNIKLGKKQIVIAAVVLVVIIAAVIIKSNWSYTVKLNDFLDVEYSGYDTVGKAEVSFDADKFNQKYSGKIVPKDYDGNAEDVDVGNMIKNSLSYTEDFDGLSNGEEITVKWHDVPDTKISEKFNCKLKYEDAVFTVEGLEAVTQANPFDKLEVTFSGTAPKGRIEITNNNEDKPFSSLDFYAEDNGSFSNGDKVTVKVSNYYGDDINKYFAEEYGVVLSQTEMEYTVEGLDSYVNAKEQLSEELINELKTQTEDVITSVTAQWNERSKLKSSEYVGYYLLTAKNTDTYGDKNRVYVVYKLTQSFTADEYNPAVDFSFYYTVRFDDIMVNDKGECSVNLNSYHKCSDRFSRDFKSGSDHHDRTYYTTGYATIDEFVQKCVSVNAEGYKSDTNIK